MLVVVKSVGKARQTMRLIERNDLLGCREGAASSPRVQGLSVFHRLSDRDGTPVESHVVVVIGSD